MHEECLVCGAPLEYLDHSETMECVFCHKTVQSTARCIHGHFVCDACHTQGIDRVIGLCLAETSKNPFEIFDKLINLPVCHMHGPEHHIIVGASLLVAYHNAGGMLNLLDAMQKMQERGRQVPGGICGFWGTCGSAVSSGIFVSIVTGSTPLSTDSWSLCNEMTSRVLAAVAEIGGPRCCKRNGYIAITEGVKFAAEKLGVAMETTAVSCHHSHRNNQCLGTKCPFNPGQPDQCQKG